jgi:hypothetical protein
MIKKCYKCQSKKELSEFWKSKKYKDGYSIYCITCEKEIGIKSRIKTGKNKLIRRSKNTPFKELGNGIDEIYLNTGDIVKVDSEYYDELIKYRWNKSKGYAAAKVNGRFVGMHKLIITTGKNQVVDHINGNTLDNRKSNLRICNKKENAAHRVKLSDNNTSGVHGVSWHKLKRKWIASIGFNKKLIFLGYFEDIKEAEKVRKEAEINYYGKFKPIFNLLRE